MSDTNGWITLEPELSDSGYVERFTVYTEGLDNLGYRLFVRCRNGILELFIDWGIEIGRSVKPPVSWKIDKGPWRRRRGWDLSTDHKATFMPEDEVMDMVHALSDAKNFWVRLHPYGKKPIDALFDVTVFASAVEPVLEALRKHEEWREARIHMSAEERFRKFFREGSI